MIWGYDFARALGGYDLGLWFINSNSTFDNNKL